MSLQLLNSAKLHSTCNYNLQTLMGQLRNGPRRFKTQQDEHLLEVPVTLFPPLLCFQRLGIYSTGPSVTEVNHAGSYSLSSVTQSHILTPNCVTRSIETGLKSLPQLQD